MDHCTAGVARRSPAAWCPHKPVLGRGGQRVLRRGSRVSGGRRQAAGAAAELPLTRGTNCVARRARRARPPCAQVYANCYPKMWPRIFSFHELWHVFVVIGSACSYALGCSLLIRDAGAGAGVSPFNDGSLTASDQGQAPPDGDDYV